MSDEASRKREMTEQTEITEETEAEPQQGLKLSVRFRSFRLFRHLSSFSFTRTLCHHQLVNSSTEKPWTNSESSAEED
jgi:hypothetical protein